MPRPSGSARHVPVGSYWQHALRDASRRGGLVLALVGVGVSQIFAAPGAVASTTSPAATAQPQRSTASLPPRSPGAVAPTTPMQLVRRLLGIPRRMAVGGSRGGSPLAVCLISPAITAASGKASAPSVPTALLPVATPTLLTAGPLNELRLERNGKVLWQRLASSTQPVEGPILWPLPPLRPGESVRLVLRPRGASSGDTAQVDLRAAPAAVLQGTASRIQALSDDPKRWQQAIHQAAGTDPALAMALLTSPEAPPSLAAVTRQLSCGGSPAGALP